MSASDGWFASGQQAVLLEVAMLPSPWRDYARPEEPWAVWRCEWCHTARTQLRSRDAEPAHPENGCLWPRAQHVLRGAVSDDPASGWPNGFTGLERGS